MANNANAIMVPCILARRPDRKLFIAHLLFVHLSLSPGADWSPWVADAYGGVGCCSAFFSVSSSLQLAALVQVYQASRANPKGKQSLMKAWLASSCFLVIARALAVD